MVAMALWSFWEAPNMTLLACMLQEQHYFTSRHWSVGIACRRMVGEANVRPYLTLTTVDLVALLRQHPPPFALPMLVDGQPGCG